MPEQFIDQMDDINFLVTLLPKRIYEMLRRYDRLNELTEIILDLGRVPEIRLKDETIKLEEFGEVSQADIDRMVKKLGTFNSDNRAGIGRTLHRISAIRNRSGKIIGLTCRIGRAIYGTIEIIRDLIESSKNILFLGAPGIGKTTKLRETARVLSDELNKRVIVVDTSNEIAGDGDIAHPAIGDARRMQVPSPDRQHAVMIEAVENHMPEAIIVDEIGTEEEAAAARTIAERGVQLVATAHGYSIENILKNPTLSDLLGGIQSVVLGDEEAKFRGTQKTVLERKSLPTFDILIEIRERDTFAIYYDVKQSVDMYLRGESIEAEIRRRKGPSSQKEFTKSQDPIKPQLIAAANNAQSNTVAIYVYGINKDHVYSACHALQVAVNVVSNITDADMVLTTRSQVQNKSKLAQIMSGRQIPLHVLNRNSASQIEKFLRNLFQLTLTDEDREREAVLEIRKICERVQLEKRPLEAAPRSAYIRRIQHSLVDEYGLHSQSVGTEPNRRVRVYATLSEA